MTTTKSAGQRRSLSRRFQTELGPIRLLPPIELSTALAVATMPGISTQSQDNATGQVAGLRFVDVVVALLLFYIPWAHFPAPRYLRTVVLSVPTWGAGNERDWSITPFLVPETLLVFLLLAVVVEARRRWASRPEPGLGLLAWTAALTVLGGGLSLTISAYPGISIGGLAGRITVLALAFAMVLCRPSPATVRFWAYAAIAGTALTGAVGLAYFYQAFGIPSSFSSLPAYRVSPGIAAYQTATYGIAGNTVDLLVMTTPTAIALMLARQASIISRTFLGLCALVMCANLLVSFERWAWICMGVSVVLILFYFRRQRRSYLVLAGLCLSAAVLGSAVIAQLGDYFAQATQPATGSNYLLRVFAWGEGLGVLAANPAGVGLGMAGIIGGLSQTSSHNFFIDIGIEGGLLALGGAAIWACRHVIAFFRVTMRGNTPDDVSFALLLGALIFVLYGIFFNSLLYLSGLMVWYAFWICFPTMAMLSVPTPERMSRLSHTDSRLRTPRLRPAASAGGPAE